MSAEFLPTIFTIFVHAARSFDRHAGGLGHGATPIISVAVGTPEAVGDSFDGTGG